MKLLRFMAVLALGFFSLGAFAQSAAPIADACAAAGGTGIFHAGGDWYPFPAYGDMAGWDELTGDMKAALIKQGDKYLEYEWKIAKATDYLDYERTGSRAKMHKVNTPNHNALTALTLAELAEGEGRYLDQIIDGVFLMTERTSWVHSYHQARQKSGRALADGRDLFIDLGAQQWASDLAVVWHFFHGEF
ncbi:MAG: heparinase, partial [Bacteroidales bacterium]|nr:heparinase [Bacteroidales bacterium]